MKRVLFISPFSSWPVYGGAVVRIQAMVTHLSQHHHVFLACRGGSDPRQVFPRCHLVPNASWRWAQFFNPLLLWRLLRLVRRERVDVIFVSSLIGGLHGLLLKLLSGRHFILDNHNVEHLQMRRAGSRYWPLMYALEWAVCHTADRVLCVSEVDRQLLASTLGVPRQKVRVVPNGAYVERLWNHQADRNAVRQRLGAAADEALLLFFGVLSYPPNRRAVECIERDVEPRLAASGSRFKIVIAGTGEAPRVQGRVLFTGFVEDLPALIKACDLVIVPLLSGSGTRFKIIESVACGSKVVSTRVGAEGLDVDLLGPAVAVCDGWDEFVRQIGLSLQRAAAPAPSAAFVAAYEWDSILSAADLLR